MLRAKHWVFLKAMEFYNSENSVVLTGQILITLTSQNVLALYSLHKCLSNQKQKYFTHFKLQ